MSIGATRAQARIAGRVAYKEGKTRSDNPYEAGTDAHTQWSVGWDDEDWAKFRADRLLGEIGGTGVTHMSAAA